MTDMLFDRAPGDRPILTDREEGTPAGVLVYTIGLVLAIILTATSFWVANTSLIWHIWWMAGVGLLGAFAALLVFAFRDEDEVEVPAEQIARFEQGHPAEVVP